MERLTLSTRASPSCGAVFTPRLVAPSRRPSSSRLCARSGKRADPSDGAHQRSALLGSVSGVALALGVFVGGAQADEGFMSSPFQGVQEMRERNQQRLDAAEESFQNSDILRELKAKTEANKAANKKAIESKYCARQADLGIGDCGGLKFIEGGKLLIPSTTTTAVQSAPDYLKNAPDYLKNAPEYLKNLFGGFFNDIKDIISPAAVEEELDKEVEAFEAELAEAEKAIKAIEADLTNIVKEATKPAEPAEEPSKPAEPEAPVETKKAAEDVTPAKPVETKAAEPEEAPAPAAAAAPAKSEEPAEKKDSADAVEVAGPSEAVEAKESPAPEAPKTQTAEESAEPVQSEEVAAPEPPADSATDSVTVSEVMDAVKTEPAPAKPLQVAEVVEVVKSAEPVQQSSDSDVPPPPPSPAE